MPNALPLALRCTRTLAMTALFLTFCGVALAGFAQSGGNYFVEAERLKRADKLEEAMIYYDSAVMANPGNHRFHFERGKCLVLLRREDQAIHALEKTITLRPDHLESYTRLAWLYERKEQYRDMIRCLEAASKHHTDPTYKVEYKLQILKALVLLDRFAEAARHIEEAKGMAPSGSQVLADLLYYEAKLLNLNGEHDLAIVTVKEALHMTDLVENHHVAKFYYELGFAYYKKGEFRNARAAFTYAKQDEFLPLIARLSPDYNLALAKAYFRLHLYEAAHDALGKCLAVEKDHPEAMDLQKALAAQRDNLGAIKAKRMYAGLETDPDRKAEKYTEVARMQIGAGLFSQAASMADSALAVNPSHWQASLCKANAYWKQGKAEAAKKELKRLMDAIGTNGEMGAEASFMMGMILKGQKDGMGARQAFEASKSSLLFRSAAEYELYGLKPQ